MEKGETKVKNEQDQVAATAATEATEEESLVVKFKKTYRFEQKDYTEIDLTGLEDLTAQDMIETDKYLKRNNTGIDVMPEVSLEYALVLASKAAHLPIEFFNGLPPKEAMKIKNRVMGFLFGSE